MQKSSFLSKIFSNIFSEAKFPINLRYFTQKQP